MDKFIERIYSYRILVSLILAATPTCIWFLLGCKTQTYVFWPMFILLFLLTIGAVKLGHLHSNFRVEEYQALPYRTIMAALMAIFLCTFYYIWKTMGCEQMTYTALSGFVGLGISFYQTFNRYEQIIFSEKNLN